MKKLFLESYGCQMNFSDSEIVAAVMENQGYTTTPDFHQADLILVNTCAIRDNAEQKVRNRLNDFGSLKEKNPGLIIGMLGCMAERLKERFLEEEKLVDLVAGPDAYRDLPKLVSEVDDGRKAVNVLLSREETYADISPVRLGGNGVTAFISIMRGCDNMCTFCVVPFTRGRERSRDPQTIAAEAEGLFQKGYREVTLLGQNVDSYLWFGGGPKKDFIKTNGEQKKNLVDFADLLEIIAKVSPELRIRFSTSHPKDMSDKVLDMMTKYQNICRYIHLPVQSGSDRVLERMNRGYTQEWYIKRISAIRSAMPGCGISTDIITGFCSETEEDHRETLALSEHVKFDFAYMFAYSERPGTYAHKKYEDNVPEEIKLRRLNEVIALQRKHSLELNKQRVGDTCHVLIEGLSKRSEEHLSGRNTQNNVIVFPKENHKKGEYVDVKVSGCTSGTLMGEVIS